MILIKKAKTYIYLCLLLVFIIFLYNIGFLNWLKNLSHSFALNTILNSKETEEVVTSCVTSTLQEDIYISKIKILESENTELRSLLNFKTKTNLQTVGATIIGKNFDAFERTVVIDKGSKDGIKTGYAAIAKDGIIIGKITKVEENLSIIRLLSDSNSKLAAMILNKDKSAGVVEGGYGLSIKMSFIPRNENIMIGEQVVTSGLEPTIPTGLLIGNIAIVENEAYKPFQQTTISPSINSDKISSVFVITEN